MKSELPANLCIIPFIHLATKPDGRVRYCCLTESELKNAVILHDDNDTPYYLSDDIDNIWNSTSIRNLRKQFLNNERPEICELCWKYEVVDENLVGTMKSLTKTIGMKSLTKIMLNNMKSLAKCICFSIFVSDFILVILVFVSDLLGRLLEHVPLHHAAAHVTDENHCTNHDMIEPDEEQLAAS